jgi:hypothetical protein
MYIVRTHRLAIYLKKNRLTTLQLCLYIIAWGICIHFFLTTTTSALKLYSFIFTIIKEYLEKEAETAQLKITVYNFINELYYLICFIISIFGIFICYLHHQKNDLNYFFQKLLALAFPLNVKICSIISTLYTLPLIFVGRFYVEKLWNLTQTSEEFSLEYNPFKILFKVAQRINLFGFIIHKLHMLKEARIIYAHINEISALFYVFALGLGLVATLWFWLSLRQEFKFISKKQVS